MALPYLQEMTVKTPILGGLSLKIAFSKSHLLLFSFCLCGKAKINLFYSGLDPETQQWVERVDNYLLFNSTNLHFKYFIYVLLLRAYQLVCKGQEQGSAE